MAVRFGPLFSLREVGFDLRATDFSIIGFTLWGTNIAMENDYL
jgi:hypothetical protein